MIDFEISDDEIFEEFPSHKLNMRTIGLQTSEIHFGKVQRTEEFRSRQTERDYSTDWVYSGIYGDLFGVKELKPTNPYTVQVEDCGNQVEEKQII